MLNAVELLPFLRWMLSMNYLKKLPKSDLIVLLDIVDEARRTQNAAQYQSCFKKMNSMFLFDAAIGIYADKSAVDNNRPHCCKSLRRSAFVLARVKP
jgi:hypothetical protein